LRRGPNATKTKFSEQSTLIDLFENPAPSVLETSKIAPRTLSVSKLYPCSFVFICGPIFGAVSNESLSKLNRPQINTDEHRY
jgi:hypothetical protein